MFNTWMNEWVSKSTSSSLQWGKGSLRKGHVSTLPSCSVLTLSCPVQGWHNRPVEVQQICCKLELTGVHRHLELSLKPCDLGRLTSWWLIFFSVTTEVMMPDQVAVRATGEVMGGLGQTALDIHCRQQSTEGAPTRGPEPPSSVLNFFQLLYGQKIKCIYLKCAI